MSDNTKITQRISDLQRIADTILYCNFLIDKESFLPKCPDISPAIKDEISQKIKQFLKTLSDSLENNIDYSPILSFTPDDVKALKIVVDKIQNRAVNKAVNTPPLSPIMLCDKNNGTHITHAPTKKEVAKSLKQFRLPDLSYLTNLYGNAIISDNDKVMVEIIGSDSDNNYSVRLVNRPEIVFAVPRDILDY